MQEQAIQQSMKEQYKCPGCLQIMTYEQLISDEHLDDPKYITKNQQGSMQSCRQSIFNFKLYKTKETTGRNAPYYCVICDATKSVAFLEKSGHLNTKAHNKEDPKVKDLLQFMNHRTIGVHFEGVFPLQLLQKYIASEQEIAENELMKRLSETQREEQRNLYLQMEIERQQKYQQEQNQLKQDFIVEIKKPKTVILKDIVVQLQDQFSQEFNCTTFGKNGKFYRLIDEERTIKENVIYDIMKDIIQYYDIDQLKQIYDCILQRLLYQEYYVDDLTICKDCQIDPDHFYNTNVEGNRNCLGVDPNLYVEFDSKEYQQLYPRRKLYTKNKQKFIIYSYQAWIEIKYRKYKQNGFKDMVNVSRIIMDQYKDKQIQDLQKLYEEYHRKLTKIVKLKDLDYDIQDSFKIQKNNCLIRLEEHKQGEFPFKLINKVEYLDKANFEKTIEEITKGNNIMNVKEYIDKMAVQLMNDDIWIIEYFITEKYSEQTRKDFIKRVVDKYLILDVDYIKINASIIQNWTQQNQQQISTSNQQIMPLEEGQKMPLLESSLNRKIDFQDHIMNLRGNTVVYFFTNIGYNKLKIYNDLDNADIHLQSTNILVKLLKNQSNQLKEQHQLQITEIEIAHESEKNIWEENKEKYQKIIDKQNNVLNVEIVNDKLIEHQRKMDNRYNGEIYVIALKQENNTNNIKCFDDLNQLKDTLKTVDDIVYIGKGPAQRKFSHKDQLRQYMLILKLQGQNIQIPQLSKINDYFNFYTYKNDGNDTLMNVEKEMIKYCAQLMKNNDKHIINNYHNDYQPLFEMSI